MDWLLLCVLVAVILLFVMLLARAKKQQMHTRNKVTEPASVLIVVGSGIKINHDPHTQLMLGVMVSLVRSIYLLEFLM